MDRTERLARAYWQHRGYLHDFCRALAKDNRESMSQFQLVLKEAEARLWNELADFMTSACERDAACTKQLGHEGPCGSMFEEAR